MYWPPAGTKVPWQLTQPVQDLLDQGERFGFRNLGTAGNTEHLRKHGDHTPWSAGKNRGWIYAKDTKMPDDFEQWLVAKCKSNYDTSWIDYFNINNRQYDNAGNRREWNADEHFHCSVAMGHEFTHVTLFTDYVTEHEHGGKDDMELTDRVPRPADIPKYLGDREPTLAWFLYALYMHVIGTEEKLKALEAELAELKGAGTPGTTADAEALASELFKKLAVAFAAKVT